MSSFYNEPIFGSDKKVIFSFSLIFYFYFVLLMSQYIGFIQNNIEA